MNERHHEMILDHTHASGVEEWYCPTCERRFLVQWPPAYKMVIVEPGNQNARHSVSKGNLRIGQLQATPSEETEFSEELRLVPWLKWFEKIDFDSKWDINVS